MQENISQIERQKRFVIRFLYWGIMIGNPAFSWKIFNSCSVSVYDCFYCSRNVE